MTESNSKKIFVDIFVKILRIFVVCFPILALTFEPKWSFWNIVAYVLIFGILPLIAFISLKGKKGYVFYIILFAIILLLFLSLVYYNNLIFVESDAESYLSEETHFTAVADTVMPSKKLIQNAQILYFEHTKYANHKFEMYQMVVKYNEDDYKLQSAILETEYSRNLSNIHTNDKNSSDHDFYFDGVRYSCYTLFSGGRDYAMAYNLCRETSTISYIFFTERDCLSSMYAGHALRIALKDSHTVITEN